MTDRQAVETPGAMSDTFKRGIALWKSGEAQAAVDLLEQLADAAAPVDTAFAERVSHKLLGYTLRISPREAEPVARRAIQRLPADAFAHRCLGDALFRQDQFEAAREPLERAVELNPLDQEARQLLVMIRRGQPTERREPAKLRVWPSRQRQFDDPRWLIRRWILGDYPGRPLVNKDTVFMTLGSCFAVNLAQRLKAADYEVHSEPMVEEINSTYANRYLLQWVEHGPIDGPTEMIDQVYGPERRERLKSALKASQVLILSLEVAPCFFERETGAFAFVSPGTEAARDYLRDQCEMRTTTVDENVANLEAILDSAQRIAGHQMAVVLTVSPVPLSGTVEYYSAVLADCISKSTLRLACEQLLKRRPDAVYWPSFEMVRWLGAHYSPQVPPVFGGDDGISRHVSTWLVDLIVELFVAYNSATPPAAPSTTLSVESTHTVT